MVSAAALIDDPLRTLRAARLAVELDLELDPETREEVRRRAPGLAAVAPERVFAELKRIVGAERPADGLLLAEDLGVTAVVLPELAALRGIEQNVFHHRDVHGHTLEVLEAVAGLQAGAEPLGEHAGAVRALLAEPLGDDLSRGDAMRFAALLHDAAKPATRGMRPDGRVTFIGHDAEGAELARDVLRRLRASERVADYVAALTRHHLKLGFLVHERPLSRRAIWRYLSATEPYARRRHRLHRRRPPRHPRAQRGARDRGAPRARARGARPGARAPRRAAARAARARRRAGRGARARARPAARRAARRARGGALRGRDRHPRRGDQPRPFAADLIAASATRTVAAIVPYSTLRGMSRWEW